MKRLFFLIAVMSSIFMTGQNTNPIITTQGATNRAAQFLGAVKVDSVLSVPVRGTNAIYTNPGLPYKGRLQVNKDTNVLQYHNGSTWVNVGSGGGGGGGVETVTGSSVDNSDPLNPVVNTPTLQEVTTEGATTDLPITAKSFTASFEDNDATFGFIDDGISTTLFLYAEAPIQINGDNDIKIGSQTSLALYSPNIYVGLTDDTNPEMVYGSPFISTNPRAIPDKAYVDAAVSGSGSGTVTSVTGTNGVTVANNTTTPVIGLGDITPTKVNVTGTGTVASFEATSSSTTGVQPVFVVKATTSADMANTFGSALNFAIQDNAGVNNLIGGISVTRLGADNSGIMNFSVANAGVYNNYATLNNAGLFKFNGTVEVPTATTSLQAVNKGQFDTALAAKQDLISGNGIPFFTGSVISWLTGNNTTYVGGDGVVRNNVTIPRTSSLGPLPTATGVVNASDTFPEAIVKVQNQVTGMTSYVSKTASYTITANDFIVDLTTGTAIFTLPTAVGAGQKQYIVKNSGAGVLTLATTSAQTIDGMATKTYSVQYSGARVVSDGSNWKIIGLF